MIIIDILLLHKAPVNDYDSRSLLFGDELGISNHKNYKRSINEKSVGFTLGHCYIRVRFNPGSVGNRC